MPATTDPYVLAEFEIIVDDGLGFTIKVYGSYLVEDHPLYINYRRTLRNITISRLAKELESFRLCDGVKSVEFSCGGLG